MQMPHRPHQFARLGLSAITTLAGMSQPLRRILLGLLLHAACAVPAFAQSMLINHGVDGSWYNPASAGQGLFIETVPSKNLLWGGWYTFDQSATRREWYTIWGDVSGASAQLTVYRSTNGAFNQPGAADLIEWGTASLRFLSCSQAVLDYEFTTDGLSGSIPLERLTPDVECMSSLEQAHSTFVTVENRWHNAKGDWLFDVCIDLGPNESHGEEVFHFDGQHLSFSMERYAATQCRGPVQVQHYSFAMQRIDTTLADLGPRKVIANRIHLTDANGNIVKQIVAFVEVDGQLQFAHGQTDGLLDDDGYPSQLFEVYAQPLTSAAD